MIELSHATKSYRPGVPVLHDVSLRVRKGEFVFLTGPSGAGKSTLLKLIYGEERPNRGMVLVNGVNVGNLRESGLYRLRRNIGVVFQDFKLLPNRTVFENVSLPLEVAGVDRRTVKRRMLLVLSMVGMQGAVNAYPSNLSGGEQQRVVIARALAADPGVILADEPTGNLDADISEEILRILYNANMKGSTVILATHDERLTETLNKRKIVLDRGRIVHS